MKLQSSFLTPSSVVDRGVDDSFYDKIKILIDDQANIDTVADNINYVIDVSDNKINIDNVANNLSHIINVDNNKTNIDNVANDLVNIDNIANDLVNIDITAENIVNINDYSKTYLGAKNYTPTTRNDGSQLQVGDLFFDTINNELRAFNGNEWQSATTATTYLKSEIDDMNNTTLTQLVAQQAQINILINN